MSRSSNTPTKLPYEPRRRNTPSRPLPPPPPGAEHGEDVEATNAFEAAQEFMSPPSPPPEARRPLPASSSQGERPSPPSNTSSSSGAQVSASHLNPYRSTLPEGFTPPTTLTPLRAHYLKKTLVNLQMNHELNLLTDPVLGANSLGLLGDPFILPEAAKRDALNRVSEIAKAEGRVGDLPFMRFLFHQFLLTFPFLSSAPPTFWSAKVQPFLSSFLATTGYTKQTGMSLEEQKLSESLMTPEERKEMDERNKLWTKTEKHMALMVGVGIKIVGGEEVVRLGQSELRRIEEAHQERRRKRLAKSRPPPPPGGAAQGQADGEGPPPSQQPLFDVNVIGVRVVTEKGRVRSKSHDEFIIRTRTAVSGDVFVSRRYGDFRRLADELRLAFPEDPLPAPPPKDKTAIASPAPQTTTTYSAYNPLRAIYGSNPPSNPSSPRPGSPSVPDEPQSPTTSNTTPLAREKNRLTLRGYLLRILDHPQVLESPVLRSFLLSKPTSLTREEAMDCQRRLEADAVREEGRRRFREEAEKRIDDLREGLSQFKGDVLSKEGGLQNVFDIVKRVEKVQDLPPAEQSVLIWGRISLAATIFQVFVAADTASDSLTAMKRIHGMTPYFVLKGILRISNPMAMIRGVLDLFLARPFGGQSLLQRMFSSSLTEDIRMLAEDIAVVAEKIDDPVLCQKIEQYANAPYEFQEIYRRDAASESLDLLVVILRSPDPPTLSRPQFQRVFKSARAYKEYKAAQEDLEDSDDDMGPEDDDAWLFEDLGLLLKLWMRKREKEQLVSLIFEGVTAELLKDIITIFYTPLAQVYKAASIADSLGDLQSFVNDMIKTIEQVEELSQEDPQRTVQTFIDLVQRHEQSFYTFVHNVHSKGKGLFDSLMAWIELFLSYAREGLPKPCDLEFILPHGGPERQAIMAEVDAVAQYHYKLKLAHEEKVRRRFDTATGAQASEEAALLGSVMATLNLSETAMGDAREVDEEDTDDEDEHGMDDDRSSSDETSIRSFPPPTPSSNTDTPRTSMSQSSPRLNARDKPQTSLAPPAEDKKNRRGSNQSGTSSIDKIRSSLERKRGSPSHDAQKGKDETKAQPRARVIVKGSSADPNSAKLSKGERRRRAKNQASLAPPEIKAIAELRPLFMEVLRPLLIPRPLKRLPPQGATTTGTPVSGSSPSLRPQ